MIFARLSEINGRGEVGVVPVLSGSRGLIGGVVLFLRIFVGNFWKFRFYSYLCSPQKQPLAVREWIFGDVAIKLEKRYGFT